MSKKTYKFKAADIDEGSLCDHTVHETNAKEAYRVAYRHWRSCQYAMVPQNIYAEEIKEEAYNSWKKRNAFVLGWSSVKKWSDFHKRKYRVMTGS